MLKLHILGQIWIAKYVILQQRYAPNHQMVADGSLSGTKAIEGTTRQGRGWQQRETGTNLVHHSSRN